jgi:hypothetical protein
VFDSPRVASKCHKPFSLFAEGYCDRFCEIHPYGGSLRFGQEFGHFYLNLSSYPNPFIPSPISFASRGGDAASFPAFRIGIRGLEGN